MLPNFLIIGAPKAGTTSLAAHLDAHPDVFVAEEKEVHYFDDNFDRGDAWYESRFAKGAGRRAVGDATPTYMFRQTALERMAALLPDAKLIAVLRNPVDRMYSHYWWMKVLRERRSFAEVCRDLLTNPEEATASEYLQGGRYLEALERVCELYPRSALHVVILERFKATPAPLYADVCRFLAIDDTVVPTGLDAVHNPSYRLRWYGLRAAMMRVRLWRKLPRLSARIDAWNRVPFRYPKMDPDVRAEMERYFEPYNKALGVWLGSDLTEWEPSAART